MNPELVSASDLDDFAPLIESRQLLPRLIRRLVASTGNSRVSIRAGEGIAVPGFDGIVTVGEGSPVLSAGEYAIEMGNASDPRRKAQDDYRKRSVQLTEPSAAAFVAITMRRWPARKGRDDKRAWAAERSKERMWREVIALDADDLEAWLDECPSVHIWLSERMGRKPLEVMALDDWWSGWSGQTEPPVPPGFLLAGRSKQVEAVRAWASGIDTVLAVSAGSADEAKGFIAACLVGQGGEDGDNRLTALAVSTPGAWARLVNRRAPLVLLPTFVNPDVPAAMRAGCRVLLGMSSREVYHPEPSELDPLGREEAAVALEAMGAAHDQADAGAVHARRSFQSWRRAHAVSPSVQRPDWAERPAAEIFRPLTLVTCWEATHAADADVVARVCQRSYEDVERELLSTDASEDPAFRRTGDLWTIAAPMDAWRLLGGGLSESEASRWLDVAIEVLSELDPALSLPSEDRPFASIHGVGRKYSDHVRRGLAEGAALLGAAENPHAHRLVRTLLEGANEDVSGATWLSLGDVLPLLAEAAPDEFLRACEEALDAAEAVLRHMFTDRDSSFWSSPGHAALLWALEGLAWSSLYLPRAAHVLARLAELDPGGTWSNRPDGSLTSVLLPWHPCTAASSTRRIEAVGGILKRSPEAGFRLLLSLLPESHGFTSGTHKPLFRDWPPEHLAVLHSDYWSEVGALYELAFEAVTEHPRRWPQLVDVIASAPEAVIEECFNRVEGLGHDFWETETGAQVWESTRRLAAHHRQYPDANRVLPRDVLDRIERILVACSPHTALLRVAYLFDDWPDVLGLDKLKYDDFAAVLSKLREDAVRDVLDQSGVDGLWEIADRSKAPWTVGVAAADAGIGISPEEVCSALSTDEGSRRLAVGGWIQRMSLIHGPDWNRSIHAQIREELPDCRARFFLALPLTAAVWRLLDHDDEEVQRGYWAGLRRVWISVDDVDEFASRAVRNGRSLLAIDVLSHHGLGVGPEAKSRAELIAAALRSTVIGDPGDPNLSGTFSWSVGRLLDMLATADIDPQVLLELEFAYHEVTIHNRKPAALYKAVLENPELFVQAICMVFFAESTRGKPELRPPPDEQQKRRGQVLYSILTSVKESPGVRPDGSLDVHGMTQWVAEARRLLHDADRLTVGDQMIGQLLAASPAGDDGVWPAEPVRELLEEVKSKHIETGIYLGYANSRGVTTRGVFDGGEQEEVIATRFDVWAEAIEATWPRTGRMLRHAARRFRGEARRMDASAQETSDGR